MGNSVYSVLQWKWHFLGCSSSRAHSSSCCSPKPRCFQNQPQHPQLWALLINYFTSLHSIVCKGHFSSHWAPTLEHHTQPNSNFLLKQPFLQCWAHQHYLGPLGCLQGSGSEEIQDKWIDLSVSNSTDFKRSKRTYFAKVEGTPQLTILQYFQQIGTQVILIFS